MMRNRSNPMLNRAGIDTASEKSRVLMPLADLTSRRILPIRNTRRTRSKVGETNIFSMISFIASPTQHTPFSVYFFLFLNFAYYQQLRFNPILYQLSGLCKLKSSNACKCREHHKHGSAEQMAFVADQCPV